MFKLGHKGLRNLEVLAMLRQSSKGHLLNLNLFCAIGLCITDIDEGQK